VFKGVSAGALVVLLAACAAPRPRPAAPQCFDDSPPKAAVLSGRIFRLDENQSELRILVYRAGPMARLGHNHVVVNRALCGAAGLSDVPGASTFWLKVPVARFEVDEPQARLEEGGDFAAEVPDDARSGTLQHLLGPAQLDADEFPSITLHGTAATAASGAPPMATLIAKVAISVAGHESSVDVPVTLRVDGRHLLATGTVELRQTALGLTPFSLMLGALQVQDAMTIKFKIAAELADAPP
jgi:hypothetical protein